MDSWREMNDVLQEGWHWELELLESLHAGPVTPGLARQLEQTLRCYAICRGKVQQWQRDFDAGKSWKMNSAAARGLSEEYLQVQEKLASRLEAIRVDGSVLPGEAERCQQLLEKIRQLELGFYDLEKERLERNRMTMVYAPPKFMLDLAEDEDSSLSGRNTYPQNFAAEPESQSGDIFSPPVLPVYAAPPQWGKKEKK